MGYSFFYLLLAAGATALLPALYRINFHSSFQLWRVSHVAMASGVGYGAAFGLSSIIYDRSMAAPMFQFALAAVLFKFRARGPSFRPLLQLPNRRATAQGDAAPSPYCVFPISYFLL